MPVLDFIGDMCKSLAWRICDAVAAVTFDKFHQDSAPIIPDAVILYIWRKRMKLYSKSRKRVLRSKSTNFSKWLMHMGKSLEYIIYNKYSCNGQKYCQKFCAKAEFPPVTVSGYYWRRFSKGPIIEAGLLQWVTHN